LSEPDVLRLIINSRLPAAERFEFMAKFARPGTSQARAQAGQSGARWTSPTRLVRPMCST
jgi:hypothetical protein